MALTAGVVITVSDFSALTVWGIFTGEAASTVSRYTNREGRMTLQEDQADKFDLGTKIRLMQDFSGEASPRVMLMSAWQERAELHDLVAKVAKTCKDMKVDLLLVENKAAGHSVAQEIQRLYDREGFGVQLIDPGAQDKLARLYSVQHIFAEGLVYAPGKAWADTVIRQVSAFPKGKHDDLVDTVSQSISYLRKAGLLTRAPEWLDNMQGDMAHTGGGTSPLYPV
jgi:predicted phage terminase large subunit-like protein